MVIKMVTLVCIILGGLIVGSYVCGLVGIFNNGKAFWFSGAAPTLKKKRYALPLHWFVYPFVLSIIIVMISPESNPNTPNSSQPDPVMSVVGETLGADQEMPALDDLNNNKYIDIPAGFTPNHSEDDAKKIVIDFLTSVWNQIPSEGNPDAHSMGNGKVWQHDGRLYYVFNASNTKLKERGLVVDVGNGKILYRAENALFDTKRWLKYAADAKKRDESEKKASYENWQGIEIVSQTRDVNTFGGGLNGDIILYNTNNEDKRVTVTIEGIDDAGINCGMFEVEARIPALQKYHATFSLPSPCTNYRIASIKKYTLF